jgi:predicted CoA-binding protein
MDKQLIDSFTAEPAVAIVGVSRSGRKFGNMALRTLRKNGVRVYPIHPLAQAIDGVRCYRRFNDLPEPVTAALVVVRPSEGVQVVRTAAEAGVKKLWLQQGAESPAVLQACRDAGITPVHGECILMYGEPKGIHRFHRWIRGVFRRLPA